MDNILRAYFIKLGFNKNSIDEWINLSKSGDISRMSGLGLIDDDEIAEVYKIIRNQKLNKI